MNTRRSVLQMFAGVVAAAAGGLPARLGEGPKPAPVLEWVERQVRRFRPKPGEVTVEPGGVAVIEWWIEWHSPGKSWLVLDGLRIAETTQWMCSADHFPCPSHGMYLLQEPGTYVVELVVPKGFEHCVTVEEIRR